MGSQGECQSKTHLQLIRLQEKAQRPDRQQLRGGGVDSGQSVVIPKVVSEVDFFFSREKKRDGEWPRAKPL